MNFTLEDFNLEPQAVEVVHPIYGHSGAFINLRPAADAIAAEAATEYRAIIESNADDLKKLEASTVFIMSCVEGWPEESNAFFMGLEFNADNLKTVLNDIRAAWLTGFIMGAIADPKNFTSSQLRKLAK